MASLGLGAFDMATGGCLGALERSAGSGGEADLSLEVVGAGKRLLEAWSRLGEGGFGGCRGGFGLEAHLKGERTMVATAWPWNQPGPLGLSSGLARLPTLKNGMDLEIQAKAGSGLAVVSLLASETTLRGPFRARLRPGLRAHDAILGATVPRHTHTALEIWWETGNNYKHHNMQHL